MKATGMKSARSKKALVKGLTLCFVFSALMTFAVSVLFTMTSNHSAVLSDEDVGLIQLEAPKEGDTKIVMETTLGTMEFVVYPEEAPQAVENFCKLAEEGYYDNTYVFRVEPDIFFSAGAPNVDGSLNMANDGATQERIPRELSAKLWPFRGALCALTSHVDGGFWKTLTGKVTYYNGSRFLVANSIEMTDEMKAELMGEDTESTKYRVGQAFAEQGGIPNYAQQLTVFGQMTSGYEVLDAITSLALEGEENAMRPKEDVQILHVTVTKFESE